MELPDLGVVKQFIKIPKVFCTSDTKKPFDQCLICDKYLLEDGTQYMIEKAVRQHIAMDVKEVIFEYAMCMDCVVMMNASLSEESRLRIAEYFQKNTDLVKRRGELLQRKSLRVQPWINRCLITGEPISRTAEYQLVAQCDGKHLLFTYMPFALSLEAMDEITSLMSNKSLGEMDDFMGKYFTGPPEVAEILRKRLIFV